jgi:hypothetical protein
MPMGQVRESGLTAFPGMEEWLRATCANAELDIPAFQRRLARCDLSSCRGMCCYDGVYVDKNTAEVLPQIARARAADFGKGGVTLPDVVITEGIWRDQTSGLKTVTRPNDFRSKVSDFPNHFDNTSCVFRADDGKCSLQTLGVGDGKHPWFYKPLTCWLHPISVSPERITIYDQKTDPYRYPDYDGFLSRTFCGRTAPLGRPAYEVLRPELEFLGGILGRDLTSPFSVVATKGA